MKALVSACLPGENRKYSGGNNLDPRVAENGFRVLEPEDLKEP